MISTHGMRFLNQTLHNIQMRSKQNAAIVIYAMKCPTFPVVLKYLNVHCKYFSCNFSGFQTCSNPSCTPDVLFTPDSQVWQSDVNQVQYICQAVILTTVTCLHLTDVLSFHLAKQQYLLMKAAIFTRNRCTIDRKNIG